jgi:hypothetical protein
MKLGRLGFAMPTKPGMLLTELVPFILLIAFMLAMFCIWLLLSEAFVFELLSGTLTSRHDI